MNFDEYQALTKTTAKYEEECREQGIPPIIYVILGLAGEAGEISDKYKKIIRDNQGKISAEKKDLIIKELGDVMWYISEISTNLDVKLSYVAEKNIEKLQGRVERNTISGSGDNR